jgi:hypothetical protein
MRLYIVIESVWNVRNTKSTPATFFDKTLNCGSYANFKCYLVKWFACFTLTIFMYYHQSTKILDHTKIWTARLIRSIFRRNTVALFGNKQWSTKLYTHILKWIKSTGLIEFYRKLLAYKGVLPECKPELSWYYRNCTLIIALNSTPEFFALVKQNDVNNKLIVQTNNKNTCILKFKAYM